MNGLGCSSLVVLLLAACSSRTTSPAAEGVQSWLRLAESASRKSLTNRCREFAPPEVMHAQNPIWLSCVDHAEGAIADEWHAMYRAALDRCIVSKGVAGCCFARRTREKLYQQEKERCEMACESATGRLPDSAPRACDPPYVMDDRVVLGEKYRFATDTVMSAVTQCEAATDAQEHCRLMPTHMERETCVELCASRTDRTRFQDGVKTCVAGAGAYYACRFKTSGLSPEWSREACETTCRTLLGAPGR